MDNIPQTLLGTNQLFTPKLKLEIDDKLWDSRQHKLK